MRRILQESALNVFTQAQLRQRQRQLADSSRAGCGLAHLWTHAMVVAVKNLATFGPSLLLLLCACKGQSDSFLTFGELCASRAEDICSAQAWSCCDEDEGSCDEPACVVDERERCNDSRARFKDEGDLSYDSEQAARLAAEQRVALDAGESPFPLGRFFQGTLADGHDCERDAQCESDYCGADSAVCESVEAGALCPAE